MIKFDNCDFFVVTGASSGIGRSIAFRINELGGKVVALGRREDKLQALQQTIKCPENLFIETKDLAQHLNGLSSWMLELARRYGKLKGLVLSAGICPLDSIKTLQLGKAKELFDINFFANLAMVKGFCDKRAKAAAGCSVVFISSLNSLEGVPGVLSYSASKGAINAAVRSLAVELAKDGIRVNSIVPGAVRTEMTKRFEEFSEKPYLSELNSKYPLGIGEPEDLADLVCFLLSKSARWITGQNIIVDGGACLV